MKPSHGKTNKKIVAVYPYPDEAEKELYQVVKYHPKDYRPRQEGPDGKWIYNLQSVRRVLYNLPAVIKAAWILHVEGEKDVESLKAIGVIGDMAATTSQGGAKGWKPELADSLKGKEVYIIPDLDKPGLEYADTVAKSLQGKASKIKIVILPGMGEIKDKHGLDVSDWIEMKKKEKKASPAILAELMEIIKAAPEWQSAIVPEVVSAPPECPDEDEGNNPPRGERGANQVLKMVLFDSNLRLAHTDSGERCLIADGEPLMIPSQECTDFLTLRHYKKTRQALRPDALKTAMMVLSAKARYEGEKEITFLRVGEKDGKFYLDLGKTRSGSRVVETDGTGWRVLEKSPVLFRRPSNQLPQKEPISGGDPWALFKYCNVSAKDRLLTLVIFICALVPGIAKPLIQLSGPQRSGKSFLMKLFKSLIDPSSSTIITLPAKDIDVALIFYRHYIAPIDNASKLWASICDMICSFISGGRIEMRTLHTTADVTSLQICCIPVFSTINSSLHERPDLTERTAKIEMCRLEDRDTRRETTLMKAFEEEIPLILGGALDVLSKAMKIYPSVILDESPRMCDFATWGVAIGEALGEGMGREFLKAYMANTGNQYSDILDGNSLYHAIVSRMTEGGELRGTFKQVLTILKEIANPDKGDTTFPAHSKSLKKHLERLRVPLADAGITFSFAGRVSAGYIIEFHKKDMKEPDAIQELVFDDSELDA